MTDYPMIRIWDAMWAIPERATFTALALAAQHNAPPLVFQHHVASPPVVRYPLWEAPDGTQWSMWPKNPTKVKQYVLAAAQRECLRIYKRPLDIVVREAQGT